MKLIFIYNANSGKLNAIFDAGHKLFNPSTYKCSLCALTYDTFTENETWKAFRKESDLIMEFYHKDEFERTFPNVNMIYPAILKLEGSQLTMVLNNDILNEIPDVEALIAKLKSSL
ncbi:GTPase [uncultured Winogradskyella sp.]|uniref:GTPase n=1 Tax=uncultured Winogradskyella sp. TaxID=395353 RepID=UPI0026138CD2|nr:GTPase [uncultured Winogradskyella sp.]